MDRKHDTMKRERERFFLLFVTKQTIKEKNRKITEAERRLTKKESSGTGKACKERKEALSPLFVVLSLKKKKAKVEKN